jgi:hypothetical protein
VRALSIWQGTARRLRKALESARPRFFISFFFFYYYYVGWHIGWPLFFPSRSQTGQTDTLGHWRARKKKKTSRMAKKGAARRLAANNARLTRLAVLLAASLVNGRGDGGVCATRGALLLFFLPSSPPHIHNPSLSFSGPLHIHPPHPRPGLRTRRPLRRPHFQWRHGDDLPGRPEAACG